MFGNTSTASEVATTITSLSPTTAVRIVSSEKRGVLGIDQRRWTINRVARRSCSSSFHSAPQLPMSDHPKSTGSTAACVVRSITA